MENTSELSWMAWTWPTGLFFIGIGAVLIIMTLLYFWKPGGGEPQKGAIFGLATTRGDRLFISLLGCAYIHLAWLGLSGLNLQGASAISIVFVIAVFRWG